METLPTVSTGRLAVHVLASKGMTMRARPGRVIFGNPCGERAGPATDGYSALGGEQSAAGRANGLLPLRKQR